MSRANLNQTNFTSGELSPEMYGRVDLTKYANGAARLRNFIPRPQGGIMRRPGSAYIATAPNSSVTTRVIIPFSFNTIQNYLIVIDNDITIYKNDTLLQTIVGHAWTQVNLLKWAQSADTLFLVHPKYPVYTITRNSAETFALAIYTFSDGPYLPEELEPIYLTNYTHTGVVEATTGAGPFVIGDVGRYVEYRKEGQFYLAKITAYTSATKVSVTVYDTVMTDFDERIRIRATPKTVVETTLDSLPISRPANQSPASARYVPPSSTTSAAAAGAGTTITASYSNTFTRQDVGKYVKMTAGAHAGKWYVITGFTSGTTVTANWLDTILCTLPTLILELTSETRVVTGTVKSGGPTAPTTGENYFKSTSFFDADLETTQMVGRHIRFNFGGIQAWGKITAVGGALVNEITIAMEENVPFNINDPTKLYSDGIPDKWYLGAWFGEIAGAQSNFYGTGYPSCVCFHEQRLCFASTYEEPQTVWMSRSNDYGNFAPTEKDSAVLDDNAITYTIVSRQVNAIRWMESGPVLLIGTTGGEWQVKAASSIAAPITPSNISVTPQSTIGSNSTTVGIRVNGAVLFIDRTGRKLRHMQYNFELDQHVTRDMNILSNHILGEAGAQATHLVYAQSPHSLFWILDDGGKLSCLTYEPDQEVYAWSRHFLGGSGIVENIAVLPNSAGTEDLLYMVVKRTINGSTTRYIERLEPSFDPTSDSDTTGQRFLDSGKTYSGVGVTTIGGLSHLVGETVRVFGNGKDLGTKVVNGSGQVTSLSESVTVAWIGLQADATLITLRPEGGSPAGTSQGKTKRIHKVAVRLRNSQEFTLNGIAYAIRGTGTGIGNESVVYTLANRDEIINLQQSWELDAQMTLVAAKAYNVGVTSLMPIVNTTE